MEGHSIIIIRLIHQIDVKILNMHALNNTASKYMKENIIELKNKSIA